MATFVFKNGYVMVNNVDLSDHVRSVSLSYSAADVEDNNMGDSTQQRLAGLKDWSLSVEFSQDYASGKVDATLFDLVGAAPFDQSSAPFGWTPHKLDPAACARNHLHLFYTREESDEIY